MTPRNALFKDFRINILVRLTIILLSFSALVLTVLLTDLWSIVFWILLAIIVLVVDFIRYVEKFKSHFLGFLDAVNQGDFSLNFQEGHKGNMDERLHGILNELNKKFRKLRLDKESRHQYLNTVIKHINVGLISYNDKGIITLMNRAAGELLRKPYLRKIDSLRHVDEKLYHAILNLNTEDRTLIKLVIGNELRHISLQATELKLEEGFEKVISMQDIGMELDEKELESWQKLVRVINHEIMNSVIPISTLANVLNHSLKHEKKDKQAEKDEIAEGLMIIEERSRGLATFVKATKSLTQIPPPVFKEIVIWNLFQRIEKLLKPELEREGIELETRISGEKLGIQADLELIEQVLINLVNNARQSFEGISGPDKKIILSGESKGKQVIILVTDNGKGIEEKELDNLFIPFYTTKKDGSGIGLPLCRQIMRLHKGSVAVHPRSERGTEVQLVF
jgi:two-component system, NtrC family, nitrogen regulation sensor histidine kinase NtrY